MPPLTPAAAEAAMPPRSSTPAFADTSLSGPLATPAEAGEIIAGLLADAPWIEPKYFYDPLGSALFELITTLPEYYLTRVEADIFARCGPAVADRIGCGGTLIDLGAGNCRKAEALFPVLAPAQFVAVDISSDYLAGVLQGLRHRHPDIEMLNVATDFSSALSLPETVRPERRLFFYAGSSIGNFTPPAALDLLRQLHQAAAAGGHLLIGVDLLKDVRVLEAAYDDALGITAAFNRNVLNHINARIGSDFAVPDWRHRAFFNAGEGRIEMHLEACRRLTVRWPGGGRTFDAGQAIHTENSYKYGPEQFADLLRQAGFVGLQMWMDPDRWFAVFVARARA